MDLNSLERVADLSHQSVEELLFGEGAAAGTQEGEQGEGLPPLLELGDGAGQEPPAQPGQAEQEQVQVEQEQPVEGVTVAVEEQSAEQPGELSGVQAEAGLEEPRQVQEGQEGGPAHEEVPPTVAAPTAQTTAGRKRKQAGGSAKGSKRSKAPAESGYDPFLDAVRAIPAGETATYSEVAKAAGRGPGAGRMVGKALRQLDLRVTDVPWWRVISSVGSLAASKHLTSGQLQRLRSEGARPDEGQSVADWCQKAGCPLVGCWVKEVERLVYTQASDSRVAHFNPQKVEKFGSEDRARERGFVRMADLVIDEE